MGTSTIVRLPISAVVAVAVLSGAAGLGYEMVWTRLLGMALGTESYAVLGVIGGLFTGLALGGWWLSRLVDRSTRPGRLYALLEIVIAVWAGVCTQLLPYLTRHLPGWLAMLDSNGQVVLLTFLLPTLVLLPATVAMGGTLAALTRWYEGGLPAARVVAGVYAANTFGAVLGTVVAVTVLFPHLGLQGTLAALAMGNVLAAGVAWHFDRGPVSPLMTKATSLPLHGLDRRGLLVLFATGLSGVGIEVLVMRAASQFLSDTIYTFAGLLAAYLLGSAIGGAVRQRVRVNAGSTSLACLLSLTTVTVLTTLFAIPVVARWVTGHGWVDPLTELGVAGLLFIPCSLAMGALYADLLEAWRARGGALGWATGVNAAGAALAPLVAAMVLIPSLGTMRSLTLLGAGYLVWLPWHGRSVRWLILPLAFCGWALLSPVELPVAIPSGGRQVASIEGPMVSASVVDDATGARYLEVNGHFRMGGTSSERSDFRQALLPLVMHPHPQTALYLGVGTGTTLSGASSYPDIQVTGVEISSEVGELIRFFETPGRASVAARVEIADARRYIAANAARYDVIVADNFHPALEGSGSLYTAEHFAAVRQRLLPGGIFCQWLPLYQLDPRSLKDVIRTFLSVYPQASAWLAHFSVRMPMLALCARPDAPLALDHISQVLRHPRLQSVLRPLELDSPLSIGGTYLGDATALGRFAGPGPLNTDDRPIIALNGLANVAALAVPPQEKLLTLIQELHPNSRQPLLVAGVEPAQLAAYWRARDRFLMAGAALEGEPRGRALIDAAAPGLLAAVRESEDFDPAYRPLLAMADALAQDDEPAARALLTALLAATPGRPEAAARLQALNARPTRP